MKSLILKNILLLILVIKVCHSEINPLFSSHIITSTINKAIICRKNNITLMKTDESEIFISQNNGFNWENISASFEKTGIKVANKKTEIGKVERIVQSEYFDSHLLFIGSHNISWVTNDCGLNIKAYNYGEKISEVYYHPLDTNWILVMALSISDSNINTENTFDLFISKNAGYTWNHLLGNVKQVTWGCRNKKQLEKGISKERIIVSLVSESTGSDSESETKQLNLVYSDDLFITKKQPLSNIKHIFVNDYSIYVSRMTESTDNVEKRLDYILNFKDSLKLFYSTLDTYSLNFKSVIINTSPNSPNLDYKFYSLNEKDEEVVLSLRQYLLSSKTSINNLYISKFGNELFNGSIESVSENEDPEFIELNGLEGVYLANRLLNNRIQTVISFNSSASWNLISKPLNTLTFIFQDKKYEEQVKRLCRHEECFLNLTEIRKMENMDIGILLSTGFISNSDNSMDIKYNLFISVDAGETWKIIFEGETIYQISNSVILVSSKDLKDKIYYSFNNGDNFFKLDIGVSDIEVQSMNMYNQTKFVVFGFIKKNGVVVGLDFKNNLEACDGMMKEKWIPYKNLGICINGENLEFFRKNPISICLDNYGTQFILSKTCLCSESDYFCDIGYKRGSNTGPCVKNFEYKQLLENEKCMSYNTKGYILIPGNKCLNGVDLNPKYSKVKNCDLTEMPLLLIISILVIVLIFIMTFYISKFIERNRTKNYMYSSSSEMKSINKDLNTSIEMSRKKTESTFGSKYELEEDSE